MRALATRQPGDIEMTKTAVDCWPQVQETLRRELGEARFDLWLKELVVAGDASLTANGAIVEIGTPNLLVQTWLRERMATEIAAAFESVTGVRPELKFTINGYLFRKMRALQESARDAHDHASGAEPLAPRTLFPAPAADEVAEVAVGSENSAALHAIQSLLDPTPGAPGTPLVIHGPAGTGKTFLLHVARRTATQRGLTAAVIVADALPPLGSGGSAPGDDPLRESLAFLGDTGVLLIDRAERLGFGARASELIDCVRKRLDRGAPVVLATSEIPGRLAGIDERTHSRIVAGITVAVASPGPELRETFLTQRTRGVERLQQCCV
jgi:chromosomal replication initiation ATPase DnaA